MNVRGLFVTGTDTGVGKTQVAGQIVRSLVADGRRVGALKPIATSGQQFDGDAWSTADAVELRSALGGNVPLDRIAPIVFSGELAPSVAMKRDGRVMTFGEIERVTRQALEQWTKHADVVVVEGVGGLLCPIAAQATVADLAISLDLPLVIVARRGLGTLNHTLMTVESARIRGLRIAGVILNGSEPTGNHMAEITNPQELAERLGDVAILADLPFDPSQTPSRTGPLIAVSWWELAATSRLSRVPGQPA